MKFKPKKFLTLLPMVALTSCGYSLSYLVEGNKYTSAVFTENFYRHWDPELQNAKEVASYNDAPTCMNFSELHHIDPQLAIEDPKNPGSLINKYDYLFQYGKDYNMMNVDHSFYYGYQSKLFDGRTECEGYYQLSRVQADADGFSIRFSKESDELKYLAINFKVTTDNTIACYNNRFPEVTEPKVWNDHELFHNSYMKLKTSVYTKNESNEIVKTSFINDLAFDNNTTNNGGSYRFVAIDLSSYNLTRMIGYSMEYEVEDELINYNLAQPNPVTNITYAAFLYELFIPYTNWN